MPYCENCGNKVSETAKFCSNCGKEKEIEFIDQSSHSNINSNQSQLKAPVKKSGYLKYIALLVIAVIAFLYFKGNAKNNYDSDGYKHGDWMEYINDDGSEEVPKDSAKLIRHVTYLHGTPVEIVKDYYPNGNIQSEFELVSKPYTKNGVRPKDKMSGYAVFFDEQTSKINGFTYFDDNGEIDLEKTFELAYEKALNDPRFDNEFFSKTEFGLFFLQNNNSIALKNLLKNQDELSPINLGNEFENSSGDYNNNSSNNTTQVFNKRCDHCYGTGKCPGCKGPFTIQYWDSRSNSWKNRDETRPGYRMCSDCKGAGIIYTGGWDYSVSPKQPLSKPCYVGGCNNGWISCNECNYPGNSSGLGVCKECKGTGSLN